MKTIIKVTISKETLHTNPERLIQPWVSIILKELLEQEAATWGRSG